MSDQSTMGTAMTLVWGAHPEMSSATRTERACDGRLEILVYDLPPAQGSERVVGWEIFADPPGYYRQVAKGKADGYDAAKADAMAAYERLQNAAA